MEIKTNKYLGLKDYKVYIEDYKNDFIKVYNVPTLLGLGKHSFLIDVTKGKLVDGSEVRLEILDKDGSVIYTEFPKYREGLLRRVSIWIYDNVSDGEAQLTIVAQAKDVPKEWIGKFNVRYQCNLIVNKQQNNFSSLRFYKNPELIVTESRVPYEYRSWVSSSSTAFFTGSNCEGGLSDKNIYFVRLNDNEFSSSAFNTTIEIDTIGTASVYDLKSNTMGLLDIQYKKDIGWNYFEKKSYVVRFENEATRSNSENFQSYANITIKNSEVFSGYIDKLKIYAKSRGTTDDNYVLVGENKVTNRELMVSQSFTMSGAF